MKTAWSKRQTGKPRITAKARMPAINKKNLAFLIVLIVFGALSWVKGFPFGGFSSKQSFEDLKLPEAVKGVEKITKEISAPEPLRSENSAEPSSLTSSGVIRWTNLQREKNGLGPVAENAKLDAAASAKVADMFKNQYFAHVSPEGKNAVFLAEKVGYDFMSIGENLALGNFENDEVLVEAWMNSPGHRANILGKNFLEMGAAVGRGEFEGKSAWLAVQEFARPLAACPQPDQNLKAGIEFSEKKLDELVAAANAIKANVENQKPQGRDEVEEYNQKVGEYNLLAKEINALSADIKTLIDAYNLQIKALNACIAQ